MTPYLVANLLGDLFNAVLFLGAGAFGVWFQHRRAQAKTASGTIDLLSKDDRIGKMLAVEAEELSNKKKLAGAAAK